VYIKGNFYAMTLSK